MHATPPYLQVKEGFIRFKWTLQTTKQWCWWVSLGSSLHSSRFVKFCSVLIVPAPGGPCNSLPVLVLWHKTTQRANLQVPAFTAWTRLPWRANSVLIISISLAIFSWLKNIVYDHLLSWTRPPDNINLILSIPTFRCKLSYIFKTSFSDTALSTFSFSFRKDTGSKTTYEAIWYTYHCIFDNSRSPSISHILGMRTVSLRAIKAAVHIIPIVHQHS